MSIVQDRKKANERGSDPEHELELRVAARRNKLLGLWAAERMGMLGDSAVEYALSLVGAEGDKNRNDRAIVKKVCEDMGARGYPINAEAVGRQLAVFASEARAEILHGRESQP